MGTQQQVAVPDVIKYFNSKAEQAVLLWNVLGEGGGGSGLVFALSKDNVDKTRIIFVRK